MPFSDTTYMTQKGYFWLQNLTFFLVSIWDQHLRIFGVPIQVSQYDHKERDKIDNTPNTQIHDRSLSWLGTYIHTLQ